MRGDGAQLDRQRVARLLVVVQPAVVPPRAVVVLPAAQHRPVGQVEPEVVGAVAVAALPSARWYLHPVVELHQVLRVPAVVRVFICLL